MDLGENIKRIRTEKGFSQTAMAKQLGISRPSYSNWELGVTRPNAKNLAKLSEIFQVTQEYLETDPDHYRLLESFSKLNEARKKVVIGVSEQQLEEQNEEKVVKLFPYKVYEKLSAGTGFSYFDDNSYDMVYWDQEKDYDFASWVFGDSMEPTYPNGSVALVKGSGFDYDGAVYAVDWDGQTYIKRVYREETGLRLVSLNSKYSDKFASYEENPRIIGQIVGNFVPIES